MKRVEEVFQEIRNNQQSVNDKLDKLIEEMQTIKAENTATKIHLSEQEENKLSGKRKVSTSEREKMNLIVAYGPNENECADGKDEFYEKLQKALDKTKSQVILAENLNVRVEKNTTRYAPYKSTKQQREKINRRLHNCFKKSKEESRGHKSEKKLRTRK
ncbi:hypothetical protein ILUMI_07843 [Ignelater luminosus]|uniref:Uncharacterized protein n=1 Tax=Ignelater luminosus TaxID=2038154 RepID=A0A8K0D6Q8_IGNLU|nr:hypothetical protein ILUMI_07843 [Ignelater luminosus]